MIKSMYVGPRNGYIISPTSYTRGRIHSWDRIINGKMYSFAVIRYKDGTGWASVTCDGDVVHEF